MHTRIRVITPVCVDDHQFSNSLDALKHQSQLVRNYNGLGILRAETNSLVSHQLIMSGRVSKIDGNFRRRILRAYTILSSA